MASTNIRKILKTQHSVISPSLQLQVFPFALSWCVQSNIMFHSYLRCSWKSKQSFRQKKRENFSTDDVTSFSPLPAFVLVVVLCGEGKKPKELI